MAYVAVLRALKLSKVSFHYQSHLPDCLIRSKMVSIYYELSYLSDKLKAYNRVLERRTLRVNPLDEQIEDAADNVIDLMSTLSSCRFLSESDTGSPTDLSEQLQEILQELRSLTDKLKNKLDQLLNDREEGEDDDNERSGQPFEADGDFSSARYAPASQDSSKLLVGLDGELQQLINTVIRNSSYANDVETIIIHGMAGIGKTTLVQQLYDHPSIASHFDTRIMVTIGPNFTCRKFLLLALHHIGRGSVESLQKLKDRKLWKDLRKFLMGQNCLIVLDDIWDDGEFIHVYDLLKRSTKGTKIIATTRVHTSFWGQIVIQKCFLNDEHSWDLLRGMVFTSSDDHCNRQLEKYGEQIAKNCEGLPLAIVSIAQLLRENEKTVEYWKKISEDENPLNISIHDNKPISKSLYLSYKMLPQHLRTCFLYVGVFPKCYKIFHSNLARFWIMEGFLITEDENAAQAKLSHLSWHSVVLIHERRSEGGVKTCGVHTVFRSLCISIAQENEFYHVIRKYVYSFPQGTNRQPRLCIHNNVVLSIKEVRNTLESMSSLRTVLCFGPQQIYPLHVDFSSTSLRILDALRIRFFVFPDQILKLLRLKYLAITYDGELPNSISKLWRLRTLIVGRHWNFKSLDAPLYLPIDIWNLKQLKHLKCIGADLLDPYTCEQEWCDHYLVLKDLVQLSGIGSRSCTKRILSRMPNLEKLGIQIQLSLGEVENFGFFQDVAEELPALKSFKLIVSSLNSQIAPTTLYFPQYIHKITLSGCRFSWKQVTIIGKMQCLKVLKLRCHSFHGSVWEPNWAYDKDFLRLEYLLLEDLDIEEWRVSPWHFLNLRRLRIRHCYKLHEIPMDIATFNALNMIEVEDCNPSLGFSAEKIKARRNDKLGVRISASWARDK